MSRGSTRLDQGVMLLAFFVASTALEVEIAETGYLPLAYASGEFTRIDHIPDPDPIDDDCLYGKCVGLLTRDGSLDQASRYACTAPDHDDVDYEENDDVDHNEPPLRCGVKFKLAETSEGNMTIASVKIALAEDSLSTLRVYNKSSVLVDEWEATLGSGLQDIPGVEGATANLMTIQGVAATGEYLSILEVEIYVVVDRVEPLGVSAATRMNISASPDDATVTVDGDPGDASSWTCFYAEGCEVTYDLGSVQSLEQLRIAFANDTDGGGTFDVFAAGEESTFSEIRMGITAGGRPVDSDDLRTFGAVRALARYIKLLFTPPSDGVIGVNEVEFRVSAVEPARPVDISTGVVSAGMLPMAVDAENPDADVNYDARSAADGGCDAAPYFEGCHIFYVKDGNMDTRWSCGYMASGLLFYDLENCDIEFNLNYHRYVRQIQVVFGGDEPKEFSIEAHADFDGWQTVVPSAISTVDETGYQTFNVSAYANAIIFSPKFQRFDDFISIKEIVILEAVEDDSASVLPIFSTISSGYVDSAGNSSEALTTFAFDFLEPGRLFYFEPAANALGTGLRMKFPEGLSFTFEYRSNWYDMGNHSVSNKTFTSAGGPSEWEYFMFDEPVNTSLYNQWRIFSVSGPSVEGSPDYPTLRILDLQALGELIVNADYKEMVTTTMIEWDLLPDIISDGLSDQEDIMTAICEHKGSTYDGIDCAGELDDTPLHINMAAGTYLLDGPVYLKSGVTLYGTGSFFDDEQASYTYWVLYDSDNNDETDEDAVLVIDGVVGATVAFIYFDSIRTATGDVVDGTLGNLCMEVRNSERALDLEPIIEHTASFWYDGQYETGNFMNFTRVNDIYIDSFPNMTGLYIEDSSNITWEAEGRFFAPDAGLSPPAGGDQTANVVIAGNSSGIVFINTPVYGGDPPIFMQSTKPLTLDGASYPYAESGDCIVEVPVTTGDDLVIQLNAEAELRKSCYCWILE